MTRIETPISGNNITMEQKPSDDTTPPTSTRQFSRRSLLKNIGASLALKALAPLVGAITPFIPSGSGEKAGVAEAAPSSDANPVQIDQLLTQTGEKYGIDGIGLKLSRAFSWKDNTWLKVYQGGVVQYIPGTGEVNLWNSLDILSDDLKLDAKLHDGSLGVTIPPKEEFDDHSGGNFAQAFNTRTNYFNPHSDVRNWIIQFRHTFETGAPTSHEVSYGDYTVTRYQRVAVQRWTEGPDKGLVQRILVGEAMKNAGLIPQDALLLEPAQKSDPATTRFVEDKISFPSTNESLSQQDFLQQMNAYIEATGRKEFVSQFKDKMLSIARGLIVGPGRIIPSEKYPQYTFARDGFWALMTIQDKGFTQQVVDRFASDQAKNPDGRFATALLHNDSKPDKRDRDEESTMMGVLTQFLLHRLGGGVDTHSLSQAYSFIQRHLQNGQYVTSGDNHPEDAGTYHYWADTFRNPSDSVITYNQGLLCVTLNALKNMDVPVDNNLITQAENRYRDLANPILTQRKGSTIIDISAMVGEGLSLYWFDRSILGPDKILATYNHVTNNSTKVVKDGRFVGFKVLSDSQGRFLSPEMFNDPNDTEGSYQNGGTWELYDALLLYSAIRHGAGNQAKELFLQRLESEHLESHEFMFTTPGKEGRFDSSRDNYGWNTFVYRILS